MNVFEALLDKKVAVLFAPPRCFELDEAVNNPAQQVCLGDDLRCIDLPQDAAGSSTGGVAAAAGIVCGMATALAASVGLRLLRLLRGCCRKGRDM